jgi:hypothetical protein
VHVLLETLDLTDASVANSSSLVVNIDVNIQSRLVFTVTGTGTTGLLNKEGKRGNLEQQAELGLGGRRDDIGEDTLLLDNDLEYIRNHTSGVTESVFLANIVRNELLVLGVVESATEVTRGEHLTLANVGSLLDVEPFAIILE